MIGGKVGGIASLILHLAHTEMKLRASAQKRAEAEAERIVQEMRDRVPEASGAARESITWAPKKGGGATVTAGGPGTTKADYDYIRALEYGRPPSKSGPGQRRQSFFRPTIEEARQDGASRIGAGVTDDMKG